MFKSKLGTEMERDRHSRVTDMELLGVGGVAVYPIIYLDQVPRTHTHVTLLCSLHEFVTSPVRIGREYGGGRGILRMR